METGAPPVFLCRQLTILDDGMRDKEMNHRVMASIKGKNTKAEVLFGRMLYGANIRGFRKNCPGVFGHPDFCFKGLKIAIFLDGDFWHGFDLARAEKDLVTNREFWLEKITRNMERDDLTNKVLKREGYLVLRFWESEFFADPGKCLAITKQAISSRKMAESFRRLG